MNPIWLILAVSQVGWANVLLFAHHSPLPQPILDLKTSLTIMKHTLLLITWSLFLCGVSSSATRRTHTAGSPLNDTSDGALLRAETWTGNLTHQWLYHGPLTPIAQLDNQGQVVARYVYGSQVGWANVFWLAHRF